VDGPFDDGVASEAAGPSGILAEVWNALRVSELSVLEAVTLADLAAGRLPDGAGPDLGCRPNLTVAVPARPLVLSHLLPVGSRSRVSFSGS
jgi:hypothetical protein